MTTDPKDAEQARLRMALADTEALEMQHGEVIKRLAAERDAALAQVAGAYEEAATEAAVEVAAHGASELAPFLRRKIRALTPADAQAALRAHPTPAPVVPAEGLDPERLVMAWMSEMEGFATRGERFMDTITDGNDVAPWLHAACQVGIDAALRSAPPVGARVTGWQPIETAPKDGVTEVLMYDPVLGMAVWPSANSPWPNVTHWMPLPEPPAAILPAGEGE